MKEAGFGRSLLKICAILCTIGCILILLTAILALTNRFPEVNQAFMDMFKNESYYAQLPANFPGLALMVSFAISLVETYLMWRAVRDPKKSTFLIILNFIALVGSGVEVCIRGTVTTTSTITSIIWTVVILIALLCARSEAAIIAEANKSKTTKSTKTTKTVKEPKEEVKTTEKKEV